MLEFFSPKLAVKSPAGKVHSVFDAPALTEQVAPAGWERFYAGFKPYLARKQAVLAPYGFKTAIKNSICSGSLF